MADTAATPAPPSSTDTTNPAAETPKTTDGTQDQTYKFDIAMSCTGCSGAVERVLKRLEGVKTYTVSLESQTAEITADPSLNYETVLEKIRKTGKAVNRGWDGGVEKPV